MGQAFIITRKEADSIDQAADTLRDIIQGRVLSNGPEARLALKELLAVYPAKIAPTWTPEPPEAA